MSGPWTSHGHVIPGVTKVDADGKRPPIARCGGPRLCPQCAREAAHATFAHVQAEQADEPTDAEVRAAAEAMDGYDSAMEGVTQSWDDLTEMSQQHYLGSARAALVAAREVSGR